MNITVFTQPNCTQCNMTKRKLEKEGLEYETVNLHDLPREAVEELMAAGHKAAPIVSVSADGKLIDEWSGFRPDKIDSVKAAA